MPVTHHLEWQDDFSVNVKELDEQHKVLFDIINGLNECVNNDLSLGDIDSILEKLIKQKNEHFSEEEKYFILYSYPGAAEHIAAHKDFENKLNNLKKREFIDIRDYTFTLVDSLTDWLVKHIKSMDHKYVKWFNEHGLR